MPSHTSSIPQTDTLEMEQLAGESASDGKSVDQVFFAKCRVFVFRLGVLTDVFLHSLRSEFFLSRDTLVDWRDSLSLLRDGLVPIELVLERRQGGSSQFESELAAVVEQYRRSIWAAIGQLGQELGDARAIINSTLFHVGEAVSCLRNWYAKLPKPLADLDARDGDPVTFPTAQGVESVLDRFFDKLESLVSGNQSGPTYSSALLDSGNLDVRRCMASRKLFLVAHYAAAMHPQVWTAERRERFASLHEELTKLVCPGSRFFRSIEDRYKAMTEPNGPLDVLVRKSFGLSD
jgi:hypothetical protein